MSHKYVTKFMWDILVQLSSLQDSGRWLLAPGHWRLVSGSASIKKPAASSQKPKLKPCFINYLRDTTLI
jgi:hypothetical protein